MNRYKTEEVLKRAAELEGLISADSFSHGVSIKDRSFWENITRLDIKELMAAAEEYISEPYPEMPDEVYLDKTQSKKNDKIVFAQMRRVEQAVLAECIENKGRFIPYIKEGIKTICARKSWVRAGHNSGFSYSDYYGVHKLVDLYSSSVAWRFANIDSCIGELLGDDIRELMKAKVKEHVLDVFMKRLDEDPEKIKINGIVPLYWLDSFDNWLCVCLSGCVCAGIYYLEKKEKALLVALYEKIIKNYLNSLPGGFCIEGLGYYGYGFGKFIAASDLIARITNGAVDLYNSDGFCDAAGYGLKIGITKDSYPSVADCQFGAKPANYCIKYFAHRTGADYDYKYEDYKLDIYFVLMLLNPYDKLKNTMPYTESDKIRTYFKEQGVLIARNNDNDFGVYIQTGNNHAPHNHNDIGTFIIAKGEESFIVDPGTANYIPISFSPERYQIEVLSSIGHSVPKVAGETQGPAKYGKGNTDCSGNRPANSFEEIEYFGAIKETDFTDEKDRIVIDMRKAYDAPSLVSLTRELVFDRINEEVTVTDSFEFSKEEDFESAVITFMPFELMNENNIVIRGKENSLDVAYDGTKGSILITCVKDSCTGDNITGEVTPMYPMRIAKKVRAKSGTVIMKFKFV